MDQIAVETTLQMTPEQFITLIIFLVVNTAAIAASWYRFGFRISKVENDARKTRQDIIELRAKNTSEAHMQLRKEYDDHVMSARCSAKRTDEKLDEISRTVNKIASDLSTHLEIHKDRERNPRRKPPHNGD